VTNYFLVNLSVADLLVTLICMPVAISQAVIKLWLYGEFMCKVTYYLQGKYAKTSLYLNIHSLCEIKYFWYVCVSLCVCVRGGGNRIKVS
jgi:hypothetical protein